MSAPGWGRCASRTGQAFPLVTWLVAFLTARPVSARLRGVAPASSLPGHAKAPAEWPGLVDATYRALDKQGVSYEKIDVTQDAESLAFIKGLGYQQAPVVVAGEDHWSGFRPDRIKAVAAAAPLALQA